MSQVAIPVSHSTSSPSAPVSLTSASSALDRYSVAIGRAFFAAIFVFTGFTHFSSHAIQMAAAQGVPLANLAVPASGILAFAGGMSILLGYRAKLGGWLVVLFLVPVTLSMHAFWTVGEPAARQLHMVMFLKNLSMVGGALLIAHFGAGPVSLDARRARA